MRAARPGIGWIGLLWALAPAFAEGADWTISGGGNLQFDWNRFSNDRVAFVDDEAIRRARFSLSAKLDKRIEAKIEYDLKSNAWTEVVAKWSLGGAHSLRAGQFKQPGFLDELTSDKSTMFIEQASPSALALSRRLGVEYAWSTPAWSVATTVFGQNLQGRNDGLGFGLRGTWLPLRDDDGFLHLGASLTSESPDSETARFSSRPEAALAARRLVDSGTLAGVDRIDRGGVELAWIHGPWTVQAEHFTALMQRNATDYRASGWYVQTGWFPFGQSRGYKSGVIDAPKVSRGEKAVELGLRMSQLDLNDATIRGGEQTNLTAGLTWWISSEIRLMANYVRVDSRRGGIGDDPRILEFRAQLAF